MDNLASKSNIVSQESSSKSKQKFKVVGAYKGRKVAGFQPLEATG